MCVPRVEAGKENSVEKVKSAFEKAMEKIARIESLSPEERDAVKQQEKVRACLAEFYKGGVSGEGLQTALRGVASVLLGEAQSNIAVSLRVSTPEEELGRRAAGILALEALKPAQKFSAIEELLLMMQKVRREAEDIRQQAYEEIRRAVEENPHLRVRPVRTPDGRAVRQIPVTVDEAVQGKMAEFLEEHEKRYEAMFGNALQRLQRELMP